MATIGSPNILVLIADDLGADNVLVTNRSPQREAFVLTDAGGPMVAGALDWVGMLLRNGLEFTQAWAQPACSPTRGSLYTGTWPWRNGVGSPMNPRLDPTLATVTALPLVLQSAGYESGLFGKWHLGNAAGAQPPDHGWNRHIGTLDGVVGDYALWPKQDSDLGYGVVVNSPVYVTRETVEEAGAWIAGIPVDTPWFATLAFHAPHRPFHEPPFGWQLPGGASPLTDDDMFNTMAQNMDANIGRLLGSGDGPAMSSIAVDQLENTVIIFVGDNGSDVDVATEEEKTTIYEGGVRVPMIVADGQAVAAAMAGTAPTPRFLDPGKLDGTSTRLVHAVDLYATIAEVTGTTASMAVDVDSQSLWRFPSLPGRRPPTREFNFSQYYTNNVQRATIRTTDFKLNYEHPDQWSLYAYRGDDVPGLEDSSATDIFAATLADLLAGGSTPAAAALDQLLDEFLASGNYAIDAAGTVPTDPR